MQLFGHPRWLVSRVSGLQHRWLPLKPGEELLPAVCGRPWHTPALVVVSSKVGGCGSASHQPRGLMCPTTMCSAEAPLTWLFHQMGVTMPVLSRAASCAALFAPGDAKTL